MTLRHLEIFAEVRRMESVTKAADSLNMAQPAVSRVIRELEGYYGTKLFERMNRKLYVTEAGEQLYLYAAAIISQFYEARDTLWDRELTAKLRIGSNVSCGQKLLPELTQCFLRKYPEIPLHFKVANSQEIEKELLLNELDFGFIDAPHKPECFISRKIKEDALLIVCAEDYPIEENVTFEQLKKHPFLVRENGSGSRQILEQFFALEGERPKIIMESTDLYSLQEMCRAGFGLLAITESMMESMAENMTESMGGKWERGSGFKRVGICAEHAKRSYCFVYHKSKYLTNSMRLFEAYVKEFFSSI